MIPRCQRRTRCASTMHERDDRGRHRSVRCEPFPSRPVKPMVRGTGEPSAKVAATPSSEPGQRSGAAAAIPPGSSQRSNVGELENATRRRRLRHDRVAPREMTPGFQLVRPSQSYVDTLIIFLPVRLLPSGPVRSLPSGIVKRLQAVNSGTVFAKPCDTVQGRWGWSIVIHQPSEDAVLVLDDYAQRYNGKIVRLDLADDLFPDSLNACKDWLKHHLVLKYRRSRNMLERAHTTYWVDHRRRSAPARNVALYCDQPSKVNGRPCVHLELKLRKARTIKRLGINRVSDILHINPAELTRRLVKLIEPRIEGIPAHKSRTRKSIGLDVLRLPEHLNFIPAKMRVQSPVGTLQHEERPGRQRCHHV
jgi:hypothetical protein